MDLALSLVLVCCAGSVLFKAFLTARGAAVPPPPPAALPAGGALPVISLLVPLYREAAVVPHLLRALAALDYPAEKLDVLLLLEPDDDETRAAVAASRGAAAFREVVSGSGPKTKPNALNQGLAAARGRYVGVYDAEDRPDPGQLKAVVATFAARPDACCVQARLGFYNRHENLLTRLFALEYQLWYGLWLPALHEMSWPFPLGGTSNFFEAETLRDLGGWDAYNVTEDAELGYRIFARGRGIALCDSETLEEATVHLGNWLRQRSRWIKGHLYTSGQMLRARGARLGARPFLSLLLFMLIPNAVTALYPVFWAVALAEWAAPVDLVQVPARLVALCWANLYFSYALSTLFFLHAAARLRDPRLVAPALLSPVYYLLHSLAGMKALVQLARIPHYWEKTSHGHSRYFAPGASG